MPYNFAADSFHTKKLCSRLSSSEFFKMEIGFFCVFEAPFGGLGLGVTYDDHLRLIGKRVVDFLIRHIPNMNMSSPSLIKEKTHKRDVSF